MKFLHVHANEMNYVIHEGITGIHTIIQITSQILLRLLLTEIVTAKSINIRTLPLMSTNSQWRRVQAVKPNTHLSKTPQLTSQVPEGATSARKPSSAEQKTLPGKVLNSVRAPASSIQKLPTLRKRTSTDDLNIQSNTTSTSDDFSRNQSRKVGHTSSRCPLSCISRYSKRSSTPEIPTSTTLSVTNSIPCSPPSGVQHVRRKADDRRIHTNADRHRRVTRISRAPDNENTNTISHRPYRKESTQSSTSSRNDENRNSKRLTVTSSKLKRSKTEILVRPKIQYKPDASKARVASTKSYRKGHKRQKNRIGESKNCSSSASGSLNTADLPFDLSSLGVKLVAAGQHGFLKNAGTGTDSVEPSFTTVNVDALPIPDLVEKSELRTRVVGTSIPAELIAKRSVYFAHRNHRSVCVQADGSDRGPCDAKTLFQKLLPRINALGTTKRHKQYSLNPSVSTSGRSCFSDLLSSSASRTLQGFRSVDSNSQRTCGTSVDVQYGSSGNVRAVLRISSNLGSKFSSRSSAVWSDKPTPIIQGVSLTPPRTPTTQQSQTFSKNSYSISTKRCASTKKRS